MFKRIKRNTFLTIAGMASIFIIAMSIIVGLVGSDFIRNDFIRTVSKIAEIETSSLNIFLQNIQNDLYRLKEDTDIITYTNDGSAYFEGRSKINAFSTLKGSDILGTSYYTISTSFNPIYSNEIGGGPSFSSIILDDSVSTFVENDDMESILLIRYTGIANSYDSVHLDPSFGMLSFLMKVKTPANNMGLLVADLNSNTLYNQKLDLRKYQYFSDSLTLLKGGDGFLRPSNLEGDYGSSIDYPSLKELYEVQENYYAYAIDLRNNCTLIMLIPMSNLQDTILVVITIDVVLSLVLITLALCAGLFMGRSIQKPLIRLKNKMVDVEKNRSKNDKLV